MVVSEGWIPARLGASATSAGMTVKLGGFSSSGSGMTDWGAGVGVKLGGCFIIVGVVFVGWVFVGWVGVVIKVGVVFIFFRVIEEVGGAVGIIVGVAVVAGLGLIQGIHHGGVLFIDEAVPASFIYGHQLSPGPPLLAGPGGADRKEVVEGELAVFHPLVEELLDEGVHFLFVGGLFGDTGVGGYGLDEEPHVAGYVGVVQGAPAQEAV